MIEGQISPINTSSKGCMHDSYKTKKTLKIGKKNYVFNSLKLAEKNGLKNISSLPFSIKILLDIMLNLVMLLAFLLLGYERLRSHNTGVNLYYKSISVNIF